MVVGECRGVRSTRFVSMQQDRWLARPLLSFAPFLCPRQILLVTQSFTSLDLTQPPRSPFLPPPALLILKLSARAPSSACFLSPSCQRCLQSHQTYLLVNQPSVGQLGDSAEICRKTREEEGSGPE